MARKMDWFRLYPEIRRDPKIRRLNPEERWLWIAILCIASDSPKRGKLLISEGMPYEPMDIADESALPVDVVNEGLSKLVKFRLIDQDDEGVYFIPKWDDRQYDYPSDTPQATRERQRRSREKKKKSQGDNKGVTDKKSSSNDDVTNVSRVSHEGETDTDTETDTETDISGGSDDIRTREGNLFKTFHEHFLSNSMQDEKLSSYLDDGIEPELIEKAIVITRENGKDIKYLWGVLNRSFERGIKTLEQFERDQQEFQERKQRANGKPIKQDSLPDWIKHTEDDSAVNGDSIDEKRKKADELLRQLGEV